MSKIFHVMFIEDDYAFNDRFLRTSPGERRFLYKIEADDAEKAYFEGVERVRKATNRTFRLNFCKTFEGMK